MKFKLLSGIMLALIITSCSQINTVENKMKLYVLDCGTIDVADISAFSPGHDKGVKKTLKNTCYLVDHPKGKMIWDTGLPDGLVEKKNGLTNGGFHLTVTKTLKSQLKEINIDPSEVKYIALSHFHFDHSGNANLFKDSALIIQKEEFSAIYSKNAKKYHFDPKSYSKLDKKKAIVIDGDYKVFGDDLVTIIKTVGHTPGHQSLKLELESEGTVVLSGDLYHFEKNRKHKRVPGFNFNKKTTIQSMNKIEDLLAKENATLWIQHDPVQFTKFKLSPQFYK